MKPVSAILIFLLSNVITFQASSQVVPSTKYSTKDGLIADRITAITQDSSGMMWFGSHYGICRYNGQKFETIKLPEHQNNKYVTTISANKSEVQAGFLFNGGAIKYKRGKAIPFTNGSDTYGTNEVSAIFNDSTGRTWIVSSHKLYVAVGDHLQPVFDFTKINNWNAVVWHLYVNDKTIWAGSTNGLYILKEHDKIIRLIDLKYAGSSIFSLTKDHYNNIWVGASNAKSVDIFLHGKLDYTICKKLYSNVTNNGVKFSGNAYSGFWGVDSKGLFNIDTNANINRFPGVIDPLSNTSCIFADRENNIWVANDPGVTKISKTNSKTFFFEELSAAGGHLINLGKNQIIATNSKYLYKLYNDQLQKLPEFRTKKDYENLGVVVPLSDNEYLVSRYFNGFWRLKYKGGKLITSSYIKEFDRRPVNLVTYINDKSNNFWIGGLNCFIRIKDGVIQENVSIKNLNTPLHITSLAIDEKDSILWLGENTNGVYKIKYSYVNGRYHYVLLHHLNKNNGLTDPFVRSLLLDNQKNLWIGTRYGGVFTYSSVNNNNLIKSFADKNKMLCTRTMKIVEEPGKAIWFASCSGVYRFLLKKEAWEHFDIGSGLPSAEVFSIAIDTLAKKVWALTLEGITTIEYDTKKTTVPPPVANITAITVLGQPDTTALISENKTNHYSSSRNSIGFGFSGSSFIDEKKILYRYKLEGYEKNWSHPTFNNNITYASLPPGNYTFKVIAANANGLWSPEAASFNFLIIRPFYKESWFLVILLFVTGLIIYLIQIYRLQQKMKLQKLRLHIARDLHDDVGSALGSINLLSQTAGRKLEKASAPEEISGTLEKIGHSAQTTLEAMDDIIWSINPEKDTWQDLLVRMKEFAIPLTEAKEIFLDLNSDAGDYNRLPVFLRRNVFLIFKEVITNSVKHADSSKIQVDIKIRDDRFFMMIKDDGKGFDINNKNNRNGIHNLHNRAALVKGKLEIISSSGKGTTIKFYCPLR